MDVQCGVQERIGVGFQAKEEISSFRSIVVILELMFQKKGIVEIFIGYNKGFCKGYNKDNYTHTTFTFRGYKKWD